MPLALLYLALELLLSHPFPICKKDGCAHAPSVRKGDDPAKLSVPTKNPKGDRHTAASEFSRIGEERFKDDMLHFSIKVTAEAAGNVCGICGQGTTASAGPRLFLADKEAIVCHACGKKHAPSLAALLDLAQVARRVGTIGRHTLVPPLESLLDLAHAAEDYTSCHAMPQRRAA
jgi:hypothetical protein